MAYSITRTNGNGIATTRQNGAKSANVALTVGTPDGDYLCVSNKAYTEKASIIQDLTEADGFITLSSFSKSASALTVYNAKVIVVKNISNIAAEIAITTYDWRNDSGSTTVDVINSVDLNEENGGSEATALRTWTMILPANEFIYLPTSRLLGYSALVGSSLESAANAPAGAVAIEPKDINSGNEYVDIHNFAGSTYFSGTDVQIAEDVALGEVAINVQDGSWFKSGDLIMVGTEVMQVESRTLNTLTVTRGLLGSTEATHSDDDDIRFFFGNESLAFDNGKCQTDQNGNFSQKGAFFGYGRTVDNNAEGVVAGSVAIGPFYSKGGYLDWGLQNIKASDSTGLAASTAYAITFVIDEYNTGGIDSTSTEQIVSFTTDSSDVTFAGSGLAVLPKIQAQLDAYFYDEASGLKNKKVSIGLHNGDIRVTSHSNHSETRVGISVSTSGTTPFDVGRFPTRVDGDQPNLQGSSHGTGATDIIVYGPASSLELEEIENPTTGKSERNAGAFLLDDGNGNLLHNGSTVGSISYLTGHLSFSCPYPNAEFKVYGETLSAHAGGVNFASATGYNSISSISARSLNSKQKSKVEVLLLG